MNKSQFSVEDAEALIPWLEAKFDEMAPVREGIVREQEELLTLLRQSRGNGESSREVELNSMYQAIDRLRFQIQKHLQEVSGRGIIVRDMERGLVDFPSLRNGREVHLCWVRGEETVGYWHETDVGFSSRQPL